MVGERIPSGPCIACLLATMLVVGSVPRIGFAESRYNAALHSITASDLHRHVSALADDVFEGRLAGSRGGHAAGNYIVDLLQGYGLTPAGEDGSYFQQLDNGFRNILAILPGNDPELSEEVIVVSGHYDHIGYGDKKTSFGPIGYIHNGADDNASGVSAILETIEAIHTSNLQPRRSILFAFWDGEELGLVGSKHWVQHPTVEIPRIKLMLNVDMIGWLREGRLELDGSRSGYGMRRLLSGPIDDNLWLDFNWELKGNTDHWPFYQQNIPVVTLHTGLHDHYHRPTDDIERINHNGLQLVGRYLFEVASEAANAKTLPIHRSLAKNETKGTQNSVERPAPAVPPRIGISWGPKTMGSQEANFDETPVEAYEQLVVRHIVPGSPANRAGLKLGDVLMAIDGEPIVDSKSLHLILLSVPGPFTFNVLRESGSDAPAELLDLQITPAGSPIRLGISWRSDEAEPGTAFLTKVVPGSPAALAGLELFDRIYEVDGQSFESENSLGELVVAKLDAQNPEIRFLVERRGHVRPVVVRLNPLRVAERVE